MTSGKDVSLPKGEVEALNLLGRQMRLAFPAFPGALRPGCVVSGGTGAWFGESTLLKMTCLLGLVGAAEPGMWACSDARQNGWLADAVCRQRCELRPGCRFGR